MQRRVLNIFRIAGDQGVFHVSRGITARDVGSSERI